MRQNVPVVVTYCGVVRSTVRRNTGNVDEIVAGLGDERKHRDAKRVSNWHCEIDHRDTLWFNINVRIRHGCHCDGEVDQRGGIQEQQVVILGSAERGSTTRQKCGFKRR
jgi:hypothetical protein